VDEAAEQALALAEVHVEQGRYDRAKEVLQRAAASMVDDPRFWRLQALCAWDHDSARALEYVHRGLAVEPHDLHLQWLAARLLRIRGELGASEALLRKGLASDPESPNLLAEYAQVLAVGGELQHAKSLVTWLLGRDPDGTHALLAAHTVALASGDTKRARAFAERRVRVDPSSGSALLALGAMEVLDDDVHAGGRHLAMAATSDLQAATGNRELFILQRKLAHPLMAPLRWLGDTGMTKGWFVMVALLFGSRAVEPFEVGGVVVQPVMVALAFAAVYLGLLAYGWVVPPLVERWIRGRLT
jgi:predicted Zn-dependent protease